MIAQKRKKEWMNKINFNTASLPFISCRLINKWLKFSESISSSVKLDNSIYLTRLLK